MPIRDGRGRFTENPETTARCAQAAALRAQGRTFQQIADQLGWANKGEAWRAVQAAREAVLHGPAEDLIRTEAAQLDELYVEALDVLSRDHLMVSHGKVICGDDGNPLLDDGPKLAAIDRLVKVRESYRKLLGLDAPSRVSVDAEKLGAEIGDLLNTIGGNGDDSTGD
jgi:hypothetical protein